MVSALIQRSDYPQYIGFYLAWNVLGEYVVWHGVFILTDIIKKCGDI